MAALNDILLLEAELRISRVKGRLQELKTASRRASPPKIPSRTQIEQWNDEEMNLRLSLMEHEIKEQREFNELERRLAKIKELYSTDSETAAKNETELNEEIADRANVLRRELGAQRQGDELNEDHLLALKSTSSMSEGDPFASISVEVKCAAHEKQQQQQQQPQQQQPQQQPHVSGSPVNGKQEKNAHTRPGVQVKIPSLTRQESKVRKLLKAQLRPQRELLQEVRDSVKSADCAKERAEKAVMKVIIRRNSFLGKMEEDALGWAPTTDNSPSRKRLMEYREMAEQSEALLGRTTGGGPPGRTAPLGEVSQTQFHQNYNRGKKNMKGKRGSLPEVNRRNAITREEVATTLLGWKPKNQKGLQRSKSEATGTLGGKKRRDSALSDEKNNETLRKEGYSSGSDSPASPSNAMIPMSLSNKTEEGAEFGASSKSKKKLQKTLTTPTRSKNVSSISRETTSAWNAPNALLAVAREYEMAIYQVLASSSEYVKCLPPDCMKSGKLSKAMFRKYLDTLPKLSVGLRRKITSDMYRYCTEIDFTSFLLWHTSQDFSDAAEETDHDTLIWSLSLEHGIPVSELERVRREFDAVCEDGRQGFSEHQFLTLVCKILKVSENDFPANRCTRGWTQLTKTKDDTVDFETFLRWFRQTFYDSVDQVFTIDMFYSGFVTITSNQRGRESSKKSSP